MQIITYYLRYKEKHSDKYYNAISGFADEVLLQSESLTGPIIDDFRGFIEKTGREEVRSKAEYTLEYLTMGVLYKIYSDDAIELFGLPEYFLSNLYKMRQECSCMKPGIDFLRGILGTIFLSPNDNMDLTFPDPSLENLKRLVDWMYASGEFSQEAKRLSAWVDFLSDKPETEICHVLATSITFAIWFEARSEEVLGSFTQNVPSFINDCDTSHRWMEDYIFCRRRRVEYHLNMVGAEIMNRAFREEFLDTRYKMVLLPSCIRFKKDDDCQVIKGPGGYTCTCCTPSCRVCQLKTLGEKYNFDVKIIPHESSAFSKDTTGHGAIGIIGVACVLNLISGGWKAKDLGFVPQCVLLDYCGCSNHWHEEGFPTDINMSQLKRILNIEAEK